MLKNLMKTKILLIVCAVLVVGVVAVVSVSAAVAANPYNQVMKALENSGKAMVKGDAFAQTQKFASGGSIAVSGNLEELLGQIIGSPLDVAAQAKLYMDADKQAMAAEAAVTLDGEPLVDGNVYFDSEQIVLACAALLGDTAYGIDLTKLEENFADSAFGPDGAYSLGIEEEQITELFSTMKEQEEMRRDAEKIAKDAVSMLVKSVKKHSEAGREKDSLTFGEKTVKTNVITIKLDGNALAAIAEDVVRYLDTEESIETFISDYATLLAADLDMEPDDLLEEYKDAVDDAKDTLEDFEDNVEEVEIEIAVSISKSAKEIVALEIKIEDDNDPVVEISMLAGPTWKAMTSLSIEIDPGYDAIKVVYTVEEDSREEFRASLKVTEDGDEMMAAKLTYEKKDGDFKAALTIDGDELILRGMMTTKGKKTTYILESLTLDGEKIKLGDIEVVINLADKLPSVGKYTDILTLDEDEIEDILADIEDVIEEIGSDIMMSVMGGLS